MGHFPMVFRRIFFVLCSPFLPSLVCLSRTEITSGGRISLAPVSQALSQESLCTPRAGAWSTSSLPASSRALHSRASHGGWGSIARPPLLPQDGGCGERLPSPARLSEGFSSSTAHTFLWPALGMCQSATVMTVKCQSSWSASINVPFCPAPSCPFGVQR